MAFYVATEDRNGVLTVEECFTEGEEIFTVDDVADFICSNGYCIESLIYFEVPDVAPEEPSTTIRLISISALQSVQKVLDALDYVLVDRTLTPGGVGYVDITIRKA